MSRQKMYKYVLCLMIWGIASSAAYHPAVYAQPIPSSAAIDQATREVDRHFREEAEEKLAPPPREPPKVVEKKVEKEPEGPTFFVKKIKLVGTVSFFPDEFDHLTEKYEGEKVSIEGLNILCKSIEREYLRKGVIAACFLPPQDVKEGIVVLRVVEAKMGRLQVKENKSLWWSKLWPQKERVAYYWDIRPGGVLRYDKMSRSLQIMNGNPDRTVTATLHAGKKPGTTDVLVDTAFNFPVHGGFSFDREGAPSTGRDEIGVSLRNNSCLFVDDTLLLGSTFGKDFTGMYAYHTVPLTNFGTSILYGYSDSKSAPQKQYIASMIRSRSRNVSFYWQQDLYKKAEYIGNFAIGIDANDKKTDTVQGPLVRDRFRILRAKATLLHRYPGCITYIRPQFSQGLNIFGAKRQNQYSSRGGQCRNTFSKFNISISHKRSLPLNLQASLNFSGQIAGEKLASQEQFSIGGINSVRGYPAQDFYGDNGARLSFELLVPSFWIPEKLKLPYDSQSVRDSITGVLFIDDAYAQKRGSLTSGERRKAHYTGIGMGVRMRLYNQSLIRMEWGFPVGNDKPITESPISPRFHISISVEDKFTEEIARIRKIVEEDRLSKKAWNLLDEEMERPKSVLRKKMYEHLDRARLAYEKGDLKEARMYYTKVNTIGRSLHEQAENYIKSCKEHQKALRKYNEEANKYYKGGNIEKARDLWLKIGKEARIKPLTFEL